MAGAIDDYMTQLERELRRRGIADPRIHAEAREHLVDAIDAGRERGLSAPDAEREGLSRFGAPEIVAAHMLEERNRMAGGVRNTLSLAWQRKWWIAVPTVCAAIVAGWMTQFVMPPRYRAEAVILVEPRPVVPGDYRRATVQQDINAQLRQINSVVRSRSRLEEIIQEFDLYRDERAKTPLVELVDQMVRDIRVTALQPDVFSLSFAATDPQTAKQVTDRLANYLIEEQVSDRAGVSSTSRFLDAQVEEVRDRLREEEAVLEERRKQNGGTQLSEADVIRYDVLKDTYRSLLVKREDSRVAEMVERRHSGQQFRILDSARPRPDGRGWPPLTLLGALAGLVIGLVLAMLPRSGAAPPPPTLAEA